MAPIDSIEKLQQEIINLHEEHLPLSRGAVFIKDPKKRRKCPLCTQNLNLYYINYVEMFLMCENSDCEFPFGYEAIQIVREESELIDNPVAASRGFFAYPSYGVTDMSSGIDSFIGADTCTMSPMSCFSDIDGLSQSDDLEEDTVSQDRPETLCARITRQIGEWQHKIQEDQEIQNSLKKIRFLTEKMNKLNDESKPIEKVIKNQKWLKTLRMWEEETGQKFLSKRENDGIVMPQPKTVITVSLKTPQNGNNAMLDISIVENKSEENSAHEVVSKDNDKEKETVDKEQHLAVNNCHEDDMTKNISKEINNTHEVCMNNSKDEVQNFVEKVPTNNSEAEGSKAEAENNVQMDIDEEEINVQNDTSISREYKNSIQEIAIIISEERENKTENSIMNNSNNINDNVTELNTNTCHEEKCSSQEVETDME